MAAPFQDPPDELIPGLPDHLSIQRILSRISWWDFGTALTVSKHWYAAILEISKNTTTKSSAARSRPRLLGCIHPAPLKRARRDHSFSHAPFFAISIQSSPGDWEILPPIPGLPSGAPLSGRCVWIDNKIFLVGGRDPQSWEFLPDVFVLDMAQDRESRIWRRCAPMSTPRSAFACIAAGDKIFVAGGQGDEVLTLASAEIYDTHRNRWENLPDLNIPRTECNGAVIGDRICVVGGYSSVEGSCLLDDEMGSTFWVSSADTIAIGSRSWETIEDFSTMGVLPGGSWEIQSGGLQSVHRSALANLLSRCSSDRWRTIDGKVASRISTGELMLLAAASGRDQAYACLCSMDSTFGHSGRVKVSLCKAVCGSNGEFANWERVDCPFELEQYGASCFLIH